MKKIWEQNGHNKILNAISVDIEDWYHGLLQISCNDWPKCESRLEENLIKVLHIFNAYSVKATFFVLGCVVEKNPKIVNLIIKEGHEVACHGYRHQLVYKQNKKQFYEDVLRSKEIIESIINTQLKGFRAPFFSITKDTLWAFDILKDLGFKYDSSIFATRNFLYGIPDARSTIYQIENTGITEFPMSVIRILGCNLPISGGFYLRSMPYFITKYGVNSYNKILKPAVIYFHPWELDFNRPNRSLSLKWRIISKYNINSMQRKIERLLSDFKFTTISEVLFGNKR